MLLLAISAHVFNGLELKALLPRQRSGNWSENSSVALPVGCEQNWLLIAAGWFSTCEHWREILQWASRLLANTILYRYKFNQRSKIWAGIWRIPVGSPKEKQRHWLSGGRAVIRTLNRTFVSWFAWSACYLNEIRTLTPVFKIRLQLGLVREKKVTDDSKKPLKEILRLRRSSLFRGRFRGLFDR